MLILMSHNRHYYYN